MLTRWQMVIITLGIASTVTVVLERGGQSVICLQNLDLPGLFEQMEELKEVGVQEYSISQTTLEHVFIHLAQRPSS